jgi:polyhydroxyalkanoate synthesis regulator phasin
VSTERGKILDMLAQGKITSEQAEKLLDAVGKPTITETAVADATPKTDPKYLRVMVESQAGGKGKETVNIRVPFQLLRAGVKLAALIPGGVPRAVKQALSENGIDVEWDKLKSSDLDEVIQHLSALQVDVDSDTEKVRVFCEW